MWSALATFGLGALGWFVIHFLFEPIKEILNMRREAQESLIVHGNLAKNAPAEDVVTEVVTAPCNAADAGRLAAAAECLGRVAARYGAVALRHQPDQGD